MDWIQNYTYTFHFIRNIRQTAVVSILKLKIIGHNHENDEKIITTSFITVIKNRPKTYVNYKQTEITGANQNSTCEN